MPSLQTQMFQSFIPSGCPHELEVALTVPCIRSWKPNLRVHSASSVCLPRPALGQELCRGMNHVFRVSA